MMIYFESVHGRNRIKKGILPGNVPFLSHETCYAFIEKKKTKKKSLELL